MSRRLEVFRCSCKGDDPKGAIIHGAEASIGLPLRLFSRKRGDELCFPPRERVEDLPLRGFMEKGGDA